MNVYDTERMAELLAPMGFAETTAVEEADVVVLNTCHIREKAAEKVYSDLGRIRERQGAPQRAGKDTIVTVAGCVAQAEGAEIVRREPSVDLVVGPQSYHRLGELMRARTSRTRRRSSRPAFPERTSSPRCPRALPARRADCLSDRAGRLRQVLHLLRRALHARRRVLAPGGRRGGRGAPAGRPRRARDHAARAERQRLSRAGARRPAVVAGAS